MFAAEHFSQVYQLATDGLANWPGASLGSGPFPLEIGLVAFYQHVQVKQVSFDHRRAPFPA
jgi:hypothetical protein